ncbi:unnamed protein product [Linum trigynum]|uniref:Uncharacterized protein n=1 Tax=Linum trigynum TaxID=586398 RepID=A0AAV2FTW6_9ROSI
MTTTRAQEENNGGDKGTASTAAQKPGNRAAMATAAKGTKTAQGMEKQSRDGHCAEEPDWAEVREELFKVSRMKGNLEDGLQEVTRSIRQVADSGRSSADKANTNADRMVLLIEKVLM